MLHARQPCKRSGKRIRTQPEIAYVCHAEKTIEHFKPGDSLWDFLAEMMRHECEIRQENQLRRRIHYARFPMQKTLEEFDLTRLEHVKPDYVKQLASCEFVR